MWQYAFLTLVFESYTWFAVVWFIQGIVQGGVWPAFIRILREVRSLSYCMHQYLELIEEMIITYCSVVRAA